MPTLSRNCIQMRRHNSGLVLGLETPAVPTRTSRRGKIYATATVPVCPWLRSVKHTGVSAIEATTYQIIVSKRSRMTAPSQASVDSMGNAGSLKARVSVKQAFVEINVRSVMHHQVKTRVMEMGSVKTMARVTAT